MNIKDIANTTRIQLEDLFAYVYPDFCDMVQLRIDTMQEWLTKYSQKDASVLRMFKVHGIKVIKQPK